jgi:polyisoprenoid-binding protein YceI
MITRISKLFIILIAISFHTNAQDKFMTRNGNIKFVSGTEVITIEGINKSSSGVIDLKTGDIACGVLIKAFEFTLATAQEHFNETYMESHLYPRATFTGKIIEINQINPKKNGTYPVTLDGNLTIRGISRPLKEQAILEVSNGKISGKTSFTVDIKDYNIQVPKVVDQRVAQQIKIDIDMRFDPSTR